MTKIIYILILLFSFQYLFSNNMNNISINIGGYIPIEMKLSTTANFSNYPGKISQEIYTSPNFLFNINYQRKVFCLKNRDIMLGAGIAYEGEARSAEKFKSIGFANIPIYLKLSSDIFKTDMSDFFLSLDLGYSIVDVTSENIKNYDKKSGGLYFASNIGILFDKNNIIQISFSLINNQFEETNLNGNKIKNDYSYSKFSLTIGKSFTF